MYTVTKRIEISAAHRLDLPYESKCENPHGHNWIIEVEVSSESLNISGMVVDFTLISKIVKKLDHQNLNCILNFNPTAENIAQWIVNEIETEINKQKLYHNNIHVSKVTVQESEGNIACYIP